MRRARFQRRVAAQFSAGYGFLQDGAHGLVIVPVLRDVRPSEKHIVGGEVVLEPLPAYFDPRFFNVPEEFAAIIPQPVQNVFVLHLVDDLRKAVEIRLVQRFHYVLLLFEVGDPRLFGDVLDGRICEAFCSDQHLGGLDDLLPCFDGAGLPGGGFLLQFLTSFWCVCSIAQI